jgi:hypothetical protein
MSGEEYLARKYCEPKAYWHCLHQLEPSGAGGHYTFDELNDPKYWLKAVAQYTQQEPSAAARQLHRRVEAARAEFRAKREKIYGERTLYAISRSREAIYAKDDAARNTFQRPETSLPERLPKSHSDRSCEKETHRPEMQTVQHSEGGRSGAILRLVRQAAPKGQPPGEQEPKAAKTAST